MDDHLPGQLTQTATPSDNEGQPLRPGNVYLAWPPKGQPRRVRIDEDPTTGDLYLAPCDRDGEPIGNSRTQRLDETSAALVWEPEGPAKC